MKQGLDKEMDSLLRRQARAARSGAHGDGAPARLESSAHLDADELSAFAENALPAAARGAAVLHLADCDECRSQAVVLARAAGVGVGSEREAAAAARFPAVEGKESFWRAWLGSLLSPRALRYAVPVLALSLVGVVSFVALRSQKDGGLLAPRGVAERNTASAPNPGLVGEANTSALSTYQQANQSSPAQPPATANSSAPANTGAGGEAARRGETSVAGDAPVAAQTRPGDSAPASPAGPSPASVGAVAETAAPPPQPLQVVGRDASGAGKKDDDKQREEMDDTARADYGNQQANRGKELQKAEQSPDGSRGKTQSPANNVANNSGGRGGELAAAQPPKPDRDVRRHNRSMNEPSARSRTPAGTAEAERRADDEAKSDDVQTVEGHRFRRQGGAWVDVKYKSSMSSTGVSRGSEAFRALVADIPLIGRVARQLGGEVIIVVSGRAYRIR